jgi:hypothetical protein
MRDSGILASVFSPAARADFRPFYPSFHPLTSTKTQKFVTRWGRWDREGLEIYGRDALYLIREPWEQCR